MVWRIGWDESPLSPPDLSSFLVHERPYETRIILLIMVLYFRRFIHGKGRRPIGPRSKSGRCHKGVVEEGGTSPEKGVNWK